jgi:hypothetical protein
LAILLLLDPIAANGQVASRMASTVQLRIDNDLLALRGAGAPPDYDYTHGTRLAVDWPSAPTRLARVLGAASHCLRVVDSAGNACVLSGVALAQEIYTPRHNLPFPVAGDRPHAAWLYGSLRLRRLGGPSLHSLALRVGLTGPPALGEALQNGLHRLLRNNLELGWSHQLPARLAMTAEYDGTRILSSVPLAAPSRFVSGHVGATLGTVRRALRAGVEGYWGFGSTGTPSADAPLVARPGRFYVTGGFEQALVLYDVFVEGTGPMLGGTRLPWVSTPFVSGGGRLGRFVIEYRYVSQGREYRSEPGRHAFGSIGVLILLH